MLAKMTNIYKERILLSGMQDLNPQIRYMAAYLFWMRGEERAKSILSNCLDSGTKGWKLRAIHALETIQDERCGPPLLRDLIMDRDEVHRQAGRAFNRLGHVAASIWLRTLCNPDPHIRRHAVRGLGSIGEAKYAHIIDEGLLDENQQGRQATADVLAQLGEEAVPATLTLISKRKLNEQSRQAAYHALNGFVSRQIRKRVKPLLDSLFSLATCFEISTIAQRSLLEWEIVSNVKPNYK